MQRINKTLNSTIKKYKIENKVKAQQALGAWEQVVKDFLPLAKGRTMALSLERGILKVAALSKDIAFEIRLYQKKLIEAINELLGKRLVFAIICEF